MQDFFACTGYAAYQGFCKLSYFYRSEISYHLLFVKSTEEIPFSSAPEDLSILYFLCDSQEIDFFFAANFRSTYHVLCLLNSDRYNSRQALYLFQQVYRRPAHTVFAVSANLAFQAAISQKRENHFFTFYIEGKLHNQNYEYFQQLKRIHFLAAAELKGDIYGR